MKKVFVILFLFAVPLVAAQVLQGDVDENGRREITNVFRIIDWLFGSGSELRCSDMADIDLNNRIDISDPVYLINYLFLGGHIYQLSLFRRAYS